jgi:thiol-disulfide isomerase/thioredoxin
MYPLLSNVADILDDQDAIVHIDWDRQKRLAQELEVFGVPTLLIYINGGEIARYSGTMNKVDLIKRIIEAKKPVSC